MLGGGKQRGGGAELHVVRGGKLMTFQEARQYLAQIVRWQRVLGQMEELLATAEEAENAIVRQRAEHQGLSGEMVSLEAQVTKLRTERDNLAADFKARLAAEKEGLSRRLDEIEGKWQVRIKNKQAELQELEGQLAEVQELHEKRLADFRTQEEEAKIRADKAAKRLEALNAEIAKLRERFG
jgi:chromosome segregation ATPase